MRGVIPDAERVFKEMLCRDIKVEIPLQQYAIVKRAAQQLHLLRFASEYNPITEHAVHLENFEKKYKLEFVKGIVKELELIEVLNTLIEAGHYLKVLLRHDIVSRGGFSHHAHSIDANIKIILRDLAENGVFNQLRERLEKDTRRLLLHNEDDFFKMIKVFTQP